MYYMSNISIGYDMDKFLFNTIDEALDYCAESSFSEANHKQVLNGARAYWGENTYETKWQIVKVIDWDRRRFEDAVTFVEQHHTGHAIFTDLATGEILRAKEYESGFDTRFDTAFANELKEEVFKWFDEMQHDFSWEQLYHHSIENLIRYCDRFGVDYKQIINRGLEP